MDYLNEEFKNYYGADWQNLVASGELGRLKSIFLQAIKDNNQLIKDFFELKTQTIKEGKKSFILEDKEYDLSKETEDKFLKYNSHRGLKRRKSLYAYRQAEPNAWIYKTLMEKKKIPLFRKCKRLILVGSGLYPYSLFDIHKKFKQIKMLGIEIDKSRYEASKMLIDYGPTKSRINVINLDGLAFDYSSLEEDDLVFISCDVDSNKIINKIIQTSKAHVFICAPYNKEWMKDSIKKSKLIFNKEGKIISP